MKTIETLEGKALLLNGPIKKGDDFYNPHSGQLHVAGDHTNFELIHKIGCQKVKILK